MEFIENYFKKKWKTSIQKRRLSKSACHFKDINLYLESLLSYRMEKENSLLVKSSIQTLGVSDYQAFFPESIDFFKTKSENKRIYTYLTLKCLALNQVSKTNWQTKESRIASCLISLSKMHLLNQWLDLEFSFFFEFQNEYITKLIGRNGRENSVIFKFWESRISSRTPMSERQAEVFKKLLVKQKRNDNLPEYLICTSPSFLGFSEEFTGLGEETFQDRKNKEKKNEEDSQRGSHAKKKELDEKKNNPVTHSFEKLETVDEYEGDNRMDSGEDELAKHKDALDEIELKNVTLDGESSSSIYKTESNLFGKSSESKLSTKIHSFLYPEWNEKKSQYMSDYCKLNVTKLEHNEMENQKENLKNKYNKLITLWRKKLLFLFNKPLWQHHLEEGAEINVDRWSRAFADLSIKQTPDYKYYSNKLLKKRDIAVAILFDQSLSTDSWIDNHRVIDIIKDSLGITGILLEDLTEKVLVASTYSVTHKNCHLILYKDFSESWLPFFSSLKKIEPIGYTRLGPSIRHVSRLLSKVSAKKKVLILITDGKPTDLDHYEGSHGINDIRKAVQEAEVKGNQVIALTLDKKDQKQFKKMFTRFEVVNSSEKFSESLFNLLYKLFK